jgi:hypothetical protein
VVFGFVEFSRMVHGRIAEFGALLLWRTRRRQNIYFVSASISLSSSTLTGSRSLVIDTLKNNLINKTSKVGLAYVYCEYGDQEQSLENVLSVIIKQLLEAHDSIPVDIADIYKQSHKIGSRFSRVTAMKMLRAAGEPLEGVYICVDALDELKDKEALLSALKDISCHLFLLTCRSYVKSVVQDYFGDVVMAQIKADTSDIKTLIKHKIAKTWTKEPDFMDEDLEQEITEKIVAGSAEKLVINLFVRSLLTVI